MSRSKTNLIPALLAFTLFPAPGFLASAGAQVAPQTYAPASGPYNPPPLPRIPFDPLGNTQPAVSNDWLTFGHDPQRTGWNNSDTTLTTKNVNHLKLLWSTPLTATPTIFAAQTLTAPVVVSGVATPSGVKTIAFTLSGDNILFAIDADSGMVLWQKSFPNPYKPIQEANWQCTNTEQATPVIDKDKGVIYFTTSDGDLRGLSLADGSEKLTPTPMVPPYSRNWSLNLFENQVYTAGGRGCGGDAAHPLVTGNVDAADIGDPAHVRVNQLYTGYGRPDGPWNRGGPVVGPNGVYVSTADGRYDPGSGFFGESVLAIRAGARGIADSFTPSNWRYLNSHDLDLGSGSPVIFAYHHRALLVIGAKEGVAYLLDANELGGFDHTRDLYATPKLGNDPDLLDRYGIWGGGATWQSANGDRFVYLPMWNAPAKSAPVFPHVNGDLSQGSIVALQVVEQNHALALAPAWISGVAQIPDSPAVDNGIVFALATGEQTIQRTVPAILGNLAKSTYRNTPVGHQILYAFDAETGQQLYSSKDLLPNWGHFSQPVAAEGKIFIVSHDAHIYAFGLK